MNHIKITGIEGNVIYDGPCSSIDFSTKINDDDNNFLFNGAKTYAPSSVSWEMSINPPDLSGFQELGFIDESKNLPELPDISNPENWTKEERQRIADILEASAGVLMRDGWTKGRLHDPHSPGRPGPPVPDYQTAINKAFSWHNVDVVMQDGTIIKKPVMEEELYYGKE